MLPREGQRKAWLLVPLLALIVTACEITITPPPPPEFPPVVHDTVTAQNTSAPTTPVLSDSVAAGATRYYRVNVNTARDLLFLEADGNDLRVTVHRPSGSVLAVSESNTYFAGSVGGLSLSAMDEAEPGFIAAGRPAVDDGGRRLQVGADTVEPLSISVNVVCFGPCTITPIGSTSTYYVAVRNLSGSSRSFDLYAANHDALDSNEPNGTQAQATAMVGLGTAVGAIEWLGDEDWFQYTGSTRYVTFDMYDQALGLRLRFPDGTTLDGLPGTRTTQIYDGDVFRVFSTAGRAGPTSTSGYNVTISNTAP